MKKIIKKLSEMQGLFLASFQQPQPEKTGDNLTPFLGWLHHGDGQPYLPIVQDFNQQFMVSIENNKAIMDEFKIIFMGDYPRKGLQDNDDSLAVDFFTKYPLLLKFFEKNLSQLDPVHIAWEQTQKEINDVDFKLHDDFFKYQRSAQSLRGTQAEEDIICRESHDPDVFAKNFRKNSAKISDNNVIKSRTFVPSSKLTNVHVYLRDGEDEQGCTRYSVHSIGNNAYQFFMMKKEFKEKVNPVTNADLHELLRKGILELVGEGIQMAKEAYKNLHFKRHRAESIAAIARLDDANDDELLQIIMDVIDNRRMEWTKGRDFPSILMDKLNTLLVLNADDAVEKPNTNREIFLAAFRAKFNLHDEEKVEKGQDIL